MNHYPLQVRARPDAPSRWLWLVKWLLLIPHYVVLAVLWVAFVVLTVVAYVAVLFTGRYPQAIWTFNVGVLRWNWRVAYYGYQVLGTDRYPPFTLAEVPDYPAGLTVDRPPRHRHWQPLVAWLFAVPHWLILAGLAGTSWQVYRSDNTAASIPIGVVSIGVLIVGITLAVTGRYPRGLYDLLVGIARWGLRVVAYVTLLTEVYPPFRLDQGGTEPDGVPPGPVDSGPGGLTAAPPPATSYAAGPAAPATARTGVAGHVVALVAGVLLLFGGIGAGVAGTAALVLNAARDSSGYVTSPTLELSSPTAAITAENMRIQLGDAWLRDQSGTGQLRMTASNPGGVPLFLGVATQADVDRWLAGTAHDELISPYNANGPRYRRAAGTARDLGSPAEQTFWLASTGGSGTVVLDWKPTNGQFAVVLARADGAQGVTSRTRVAARTPDLRSFGLGVLTSGFLLLAGAFALIYFGAAGIGRRHTTPPPPVRPVPPVPPVPPAPPAVRAGAGIGR
jgi:hypothetical protein